MLKKLKSLLADDVIYLGGLLILTSIISFGLGRLSGGGRVAIAPEQAAVGLISAQNAPQVQNTATTSTPAFSSKSASIEVSQAPFVASKSSTKYHKVSCPGAKSIKEANKIYFTTETEAESAGYTKAANCKW